MPDSGVEVSFILLQRFDCDNQVPGAIGFRDVCSGSGFQSFVNHLLRFHDAQNRYLLMRIVVHNLPSSVESIQCWHADIQNDDVRFEANNFLHCFAAVPGFTTYFPCGMRCQQSADTATNDFMVISNKNTQSHKNTSIGNLTANGFVQNLCDTRKESFRTIQTVYVSIYQLSGGLAIGGDGINWSPLV